MSQTVYNRLTSVSPLSTVQFDHVLFTFHSTKVFIVDIQYRSELYPDIMMWFDTVLLLFTVLVASFFIQFFVITLSDVTAESSSYHHITDLLRDKFPS